MNWLERFIPPALKKRFKPVKRERDFVQETQLQAQLGSIKGEVLRLYELAQQAESDTLRLQYLLQQLPVPRPPLGDASPELLAQMEEINVVQTRLHNSLAVVLHGGFSADDAGEQVVRKPEPALALRVDGLYDELINLVGCGVLSEQEASALVSKWEIYIKYFIELSEPIEKLMEYSVAWIKGGNISSEK